MEYKYEYKDLSERELILNTHNDLVLIEEQNITEGNFLIFIDAVSALEIAKKQILARRISTIIEYAQLQGESTLSSIEDTILEIETNKILNGGI